MTIEVPTREGAFLRGMRWSPEGAGRAPVVLVLTPYGADAYHPDGTAFAAAGFHFVSLDVRGRGDSDGTFRPFVHDGADGHDAVRRLAAQEWSSGDVLLYGGSYSGFAQWAVAATRPPGLRAIAPVASVFPGVDFPMAHGIPKSFAARWLTLVDGRRMNNGPFADDALWAEAGERLIATGRPFRDLDLVAVGRRLPAFQEWLDHPTLDAYWDALVPTPEQYAGISVPVLTITGQYDDDQLGALTHHDRHVRAVPGARHDVVIGPWDHAATRSGGRRFGGLTFAEASSIDLRELHIGWYRWVLGLGERPAFLADRVTYFHVGEDRWRAAPDLPGGTGLRLHPVADHGLTPEAPTEHRRLTLLLDPATAGAPERAQPPAHRVFTDDRPFALPAGPGTAVHVTAPFTSPVDVTGRPAASLTLSSALPDFDLLAGIHVLPAEGSPRLLAEAALRARHHAGTPWPADHPVRVELRDFPFVSQRLEPGDRLALVLRAPHRRWQPNFQSGAPVSAETLADATAGEVHILQGPSHTSYLTLPAAGGMP
ncbi:CocE/NonD family hydrolase [Streptomyces sp. NPDC020983]|uniref:CocE/NonD family hydrolase n=1 Tax=Streptomyces sp. NPDC020983 TaxID=3365106 RepID=UPI003799AE53